MARGLFAAAFSIFALWLAGCAPDRAREADWQAMLEAELAALQSANPETPGFAAVVITPERTFAAATGVADPDGAPMTVETPVRIASITKTFVAATVLVLADEGLFAIDAPIAGLIDPYFVDLLRADGYDPSAITVRQLLTHSSGMADHAGEAYIGAIIAEPTRFWTRADQIRFLVDQTDPIGAPGEQFHYSDTGYLLLGDIIERATRKTLAAVVRDRLGFDRIGIGDAFWEVYEPEQSRLRAHQYIQGMDIHGWSGSLDAYGGGGLVLSTEEMALFFAALFEGQLFERKALLTEMTAAQSTDFPDHYRIGLFPLKISDSTSFGHGGFWGTFAFYVPETKTAVAITALSQAGEVPLRNAVIDFVADMNAARD